MDRRPLLLLALAGLLFITLPSFFERLHSDEVIYWEVARNIARGLGPISGSIDNASFVWHMPLPYYLTAPFLLISEHILAARAVASVLTIGSAIIVYLISRDELGRWGGLVPPFLFLMSFQALRFGGRFYLDQFGAFFFLLSLWSLKRGSPVNAGLSALIAVFSRELWGVTYPFMALYALLAAGRRAALAFVAPLGCLLLLAAPILAWKADALMGAVAGTSALKNVEASLFGHGATGYAIRLAKGWAEFSILNILALMPAVASLARDRRLLLVVLPQAGAISLVHGFVVDGGVTQYPMGLAATLAAISGPGIRLVREKTGWLSGRAFAAALGAQFVFFNVFATAVARHGSATVYGLGFWDDCRVISILEAEARGGFIGGIHGAFVEGKKGWSWTDYLVQEAIDKDPDWLVTFRDYVYIVPQVNKVTNLKIYEIGPYIVVSAPPGKPLADFVREGRVKKWALALPEGKAPGPGQIDGPGL